MNVPVNGTKCQGNNLWGNSLSSAMIEQTTIIQAALTSIEEMVDGTKSRFEAWTKAIENAAQISGQNAICIAFSKLIGSPLLTANRLKTRSPNLTWTECEKELSMQYSIIPSTLMQPRLSPI